MTETNYYTGENAFVREKIGELHIIRQPIKRKIQCHINSKHTFKPKIDIAEKHHCFSLFLSKFLSYI